MRQETFENLFTVREEAHAMLDNLRAVKGPRHMHLVRALLLCANASEIIGIACSVESMDETARKVIENAFLHCLHGIILNMQAAGEFDPELIAACIKDAESLGDSVEGLLRQAVKSGESGRVFGGGSAQ